MFSRDVARLTSQAGRCSWGLPFRYLDFDFPGLDATPQQASWVDLKISNIHFWRFERYWKKIIPTYKTWREREREREIMRGIIFHEFLFLFHRHFLLFHSPSCTSQKHWPLRRLVCVWLRWLHQWHQAVATSWWRQGGFYDNYGYGWFQSKSWN